LLKANTISSNHVVNFANLIENLALI